MFSLTDNGEIKICSNHQEYQVPLIWTFKFRGAEFWCPYCGYQEGMFGAGINVPETDELKDRLAMFKEHATKFLSDSGHTEIGVKWDYKIKIEELTK